MNGASSIVGLLVVDNRGLCIQAEGVGDPTAAGLLGSLANQAALLEPGRDNPVVLLETDQYNYLVKKQENVTVAVVKTN